MDTTKEITPEDSVVPVYSIPMTAEEIAASEYSREIFIAEQQAREEARQSALAKLEALGLTTEEIKALTGGN